MHTNEFTGQSQQGRQRPNKDQALKARRVTRTTARPLEGIGQFGDSQQAPSDETHKPRYGAGF